MSLPAELAPIFDLFRVGFERGRMAHAYLVVGAPRGEGGAFTAEALALLFCTATDGAKPCHACDGCRRADSGHHPDVLWVEPAMKSRIIGKDAVHEAMRMIWQTSFAGGWKACVIVGADRLGEDAANVFLKTIEEPPPCCLFLLLTDNPAGVLPTIFSRCQQIGLSGAQVGLPLEWREPLLAILGAAEDRNGVAGAMSRAGALLALMKKMHEKVENDESESYTPPPEMKREESEKVLNARIEARYRELRQLVLRALLLWYRDQMVLVSGADAGLIHYSDQHATLISQTAGLTWSKAMTQVQSVEEMQRQLDRNLPEDTVLNFGFERLMV
ncbi:MAG: DNA polymerase III subunit [bacterium]